MNTNYEIVHRGDYQKVLLLIWIEKLIHCLAINQSLPSPPNIMVSCELPLWRWALLRISLGVGAWQESIFDNQSLVFDKRSEILSTKNLQDYVKNSKAWWEKITNYIYQIEAFYPLEESDLLRLEKSSLSKKEKLQFLKRYHPDMIDWDLIDHSLRSSYEALIQNNFIKINEKIHT